MQAKMDKEQIFRIVSEKKVKVIWLWFADILGQLKGVAVGREELKDTLERGMGFDGSSVEGFARIHESDLMAIPDLNTLRLRPARPGSNDESAIHLICDLETPDGQPFEGDPRHVLRRNLERIQKQGYLMNVGPEMEYFYFASADGVVPLDETGYFDATVNSKGTFLRNKTVEVLESMGLRCEASHHEVAPSQHEIDIRFDDALTMADQVLLVRFMVKEIARENNLYATFMPKPLFGENGSGMHVHQSIFKDGHNLFFDAKAPYNLSPFARKYIAGILRHIPEITLILNQWVNSYKRLVPGYEAPVYLSWGQKNRSALVRVPRYRVGHEQACRIEVRSADPVCNPYLAFSVMLAAGMRGVEKGYELPDPIEENIFEMTPAERRERGISTLPGNLYEAIEIAEKSELLREVLGEHIFEKFMDNKKIEWDRYRMQVTDYELREYLPIM